MNSRTYHKGTPTAQLSSRPDAAAEEIINTAVRMVMDVGLAAAEEYLRGQGVSKRTALRVLSHNSLVRRKQR